MLSVLKALQILTRDFVGDELRSENDRKTAAKAAWDSFGAVANAGDPEREADRAQTALIVRAMISAAAADGRVDAEERRRIQARLDRADLLPSERAEIEREFEAPMPIYALARAFETPEQARAVYAGAVAAVVVDTPEETDFLRSLRQRLDLPAEAVATVHARFGLDGN